ncbi:hypothetical protein EVAR_42591_1 [Eumeta japonica]|uniref:Uncharacterized protein n=1 Tax=Eumeta variegata TaxID=151549 RepID=A0A4C1XLJ3_EUMVA|nr:hypothetical protein EVAR_42591_1 [Eumeta japonica]
MNDRRDASRTRKARSPTASLLTARWRLDARPGDKEVYASQAERSDRSCLSIIPRSRSQVERDNESCFFVHAAGVNRLIKHTAKYMRSWIDAKVNRHIITFAQSGQPARRPGRRRKMCPSHVMMPISRLRVAVHTSRRALMRCASNYLYTGHLSDNFLWEGKPLRNITRYGASLSGIPFLYAYGNGGQAPPLSL